MADKELKIIVSAVDEASKTLSNIGNNMNQLGQQMTAVGKKLTVGLTLPLVAFGAVSMKTFMDIETQWKEVQKVYGSTADSFMRDNGMLQKSVDELSVKFGQSKSATLDALAGLSAMGYEGSQAIDMLTQTMEFATTGNMEMSKSMETIVATSKIFNIQGQDLRKTLAMMNTVENSTAASMADLGEAVQTAGNSALVAKIGVQGLAGMMAVLRERAVPAGEAANSLKTILSRVYRTTEESEKILKKYNISIWETEQVTGKLTKTVGGNADEVKRLQGKLKSLTNSYSDYQEKISGANLSDDERNKKLGEITTQMDNVKQAISKNTGVAQTSSGTYEKLTGNFKAADDVLRQLAKSWKDMNDAEKDEIIMANAGLMQKDKFIALMQDLSSENSTYENVLKGVTDETANLSKYEQEMQIFLDTNAVKVKQAGVAFDNMKIAIGGVLAEAIIPLVSKLSGLAKSFSELDPNIQKGIVYFGMFLAVLGPLLLIFGQILVVAPALIAFFGGISLPVLAVVVAIGLLIAAGIYLITHWEQVKTTAITVWGVITTFVTNILTNLSNFFTTIFTTILTTVTTIWTAITQNVFVQYFVSAVGVIISALNLVASVFELIFSIIYAVVSVIVLAIVAIVKNQFEFMLQIAISILKLLKAGFDLYLTAMKTIVTTVLTFIKTHFGTELTQTKNTVVTILNALKTVFETVLGGIKNFVQGWVTTVTGFFNSLAKAIDNVASKVRGVGDAIRGLPGKVASGLGFQHGGVVPGGAGQAVPALLHGGERVISRTGTDVNRGGSSAGITVNLIVEGDVNSMEMVDYLVAKIKDSLGRDNELAQQGVGV